jgi:hypothetical protein
MATGKVRTLSLVAADGHTTASVTEPATLTSSRLVAYVP